MAPITIIPKACSCCKGERSSRDKSSNLPLPNILYEGSEGSKGRFLGLTGPMGRRVLKFDGPLAPRVVVAADAADFKEKGRGFAAGCVEGLCSLCSGADGPSGRGGWIAALRQCL